MKLALALVFCLGVALARVEEWSWMDNMDTIRNIDDYEFQSGREFHYVYNGQMTTGIPGSSKQHSGTRVQAMVTFVFKNSNTCLMKINNVRMGKMNRDLPNPRKVVPFEMFEEMPIEHQYKQQLLLPIKFTYNGGLIKNIVFDGEDHPWSTNIKRGILNLLQVNIQKQGIMEETFEEERLTNVYRPTEIDNSKFFRVMEQTLEGECETLYTITKQPTNKRMYNRNVMNVTKTINFEKCLKRPQIKYNFRFSDPCPTCESKYNDDQKFLKSSTVAFYNITGTVNKFMIDSARIESEYTFIPFNEESNVIVTYTNQTLVLVKTTPVTHRVEEPRNQIESDSDMVFTLDWDVAKETFFMEDDTTMMRKFKLPEMRNKIEIIGSLLHKLVSRIQESVEVDAPKYLDRLITLFRLCTRQEIEQIHNTFYRSTQFNHEQQKKIRDILPHIEALCGTKVCVQHLVEKIRTNEIPTLTAILAVKDLINVRTPSKEIIQELLKLTECEVVERQYALKQSVWLTIGSLMNGLCSNGVDQWAREMKGKSQKLWAREMRQTTDKLFWTKDIKENIENMLTVKMEEKNEKFCPRHLKEKYVQLLISKLQTTNKWEERLTYLKALGNAGLDLSIFELEKIVLNRERKYSTLIRTEAILAMRQLKDIMPKKIQKVLMPVLLNKLESPTMRIAASYMILQTLPQLPVLVQIAQMVQTERHIQVSSFVHSYMETLANSTNPCEIKLVSDMKLALRHTRKIDTTPFGYSKIQRIPIHSVHHKVGLDLELASSFSNMSFIPRYLTATLHSNFLGFWNKYLVSFGLVTEGLENVMRRFSRDHFSQEQDIFNEDMFNMKDYEQEFNNMFSSLNFNDEITKEPKALLYMKFKDQDYGFLPIKREFIKSMMTENKFNLREIESKLRQGLLINFNKVSMLHEMTYKIPTTFGMPLTVTTKIPMVMSVHGKFQAATSERSLRSMMINVNLKPSFVATLIVDVQSWCPIVNHGLRVVHKLKMFKPIDAKLEVDMESKPMNVRLTIRPPTTRRELFSFETKPITYTRVWTKLEEPEQKVVIGEEVKNVHTFNKCIGRKVFGVELCLRGKVHKTPSTSMVGTPFFPLSGPNKVVLTVEPGHEMPQEIVINLSGKFLERTMESIRQPLFREFENINSFDEDREDTMFSTDNEYTRRTSRYNPFSYFYSEESERRMSEPMTTTLRVDIQARPRHFTFDLVHLLDIEQGQCKLQLKLKSNPTTECQGFVACLNSESVLPRFTRDITENKVMTKARLTWGRTTCKPENHITLKSKVVKSHLENLFESDMPEYNMYESSEYEPMYETSFKNEFTPEMKQLLKYHIDIDYNNVPFFVQNYTNKVFLMLKNYFYEQSDVSQIMVRNPEKKIRAIVIVDPITKQYTLKIKTPKENTNIHNIQTPYFLTSMKTRRSHMKNFWSTMNEDSRKTWMNNDETSTGMCQVSGRKVNTFDNVEYTVPMTNSYVVLAKDCSSDNFVVLMRKLTERKDLKEIKIQTPQHEIVLTPMTESYERVMVTVDDRQVNLNEDIELTESGRPVIRIIKEGSQIRVELMNKGINVVFDGCTCNVELSEISRRQLCGLCSQVDDEFTSNENTRDYYHQDLNQEREFPRRAMEEDCDDYSCSKKRQWGYDKPEWTMDETEPFEKDCDDYTCSSKRQWGYDNKDWTFENTNTFENFEQNEEYETEFDRSNVNMRPILKHKLVEYEDKICVSLERIPQCPVNTQVEKEVEKHISFHCLNRNSPLIEKLETKVRYGERIPQIQRLTPSMTRTEVVPIKCTPLY